MRGLATANVGLLTSSRSPTPVTRSLTGRTDPDAFETVSVVLMAPAGLTTLRQGTISAAVGVAGFEGPRPSEADADRMQLVVDGGVDGVTTATCATVTLLLLLLLLFAGAADEDELAAAEGSYLSRTLSSRLRSSSKTECLASKQRTMSDGSCDFSSSRLSGRGLVRRRNRSAVSPPAPALPPPTGVLPPDEWVDRVDHCS